MHRNDSRWIGNDMNIPVTADALDTNPSHMIFEAPLGRLERRKAFEMQEKNIRAWIRVDFVLIDFHEQSPIAEGITNFLRFFHDFVANQFIQLQWQKDMNK